MTPGIYPGMDEVTYHGDPDSVSASGLKLILKAPALFKWQKDNPPAPKDHFDIGTACHSKVLGTGAPTAIYPAAMLSSDGKATTKAAKEFGVEARKAGKVPLLQKDADAVDAMAEAVLGHPVARRLLTGGDSELSVFWHDDEWDIIRRARIDHLAAGFNGDIISDLKTTVSADPKRLPKTIVDYGYDLSASHYIDAARGAGIEVSAYSLIFVEKEPPHLVTVADLSGDFLARGRDLCRAALERYRDCLAADVWPGYVGPNDYITVSPPAWATREDYAA